MRSLNRIIMNRRSRAILRDIGTEDLDIAEISGQWGAKLPARSYVNYRFRQHDICSGPVTYADGTVLKYDLILANQVGDMGTLKAAIDFAVDPKVGRKQAAA